MSELANESSAQTENLTQRWQAAMMNNYGTPPLTLVRGSGAEVWDADGNRYLDLVGGIAVNALGHAHPAVVEAVTTQLQTLGHTSNLYITEPPLELAEKLLELLDRPGRVAASATPAPRPTRPRSRWPAAPAARRSSPAENAFHGRTMGALALTGQEPKRAPFEPMTPGVAHIPYGDVAALDAAVDADTAAVFLEPILGEAGAVNPPEGYLQAARRDHRRARRPARARRGADRHRPHRRVVRVPAGRRRARRRHAGQGPRRRAADRRVHRPRRRGRAAASPASTARRSAATRCVAAAALAVLRTIAAEGLLEHVTQVGKEIATAVEGLGHPLVTRRQRRRTADRHRPARAGVRRGGRRPPAPPASSSTTRCPTGCGSSRRSCSPRPRPREFLAALPEVPGRRQ